MLHKITKLFDIALPHCVFTISALLDNKHIDLRLQVNPRSKIYQIYTKFSIYTKSKICIPSTMKIYQNFQYLYIYVYTSWQHCCETSQKLGFLVLLDWSNWHEPEMSTDRTGSGLRSILAEPGLDRTAIFLKIGGSGLDRTEKNFVVLM